MNELLKKRASEIKYIIKRRKAMNLVFFINCKNNIATKAIKLKIKSDFKYLFIINVRSKMIYPSSINQVFSLIMILRTSIKERKYITSSINRYS